MDMPIRWSVGWYTFGDPAGLLLASLAHSPICLEFVLGHWVTIAPVGRLANEPVPPELFHSKWILMCFGVLGIELLLGVPVANHRDDDLGHRDPFGLAILRSASALFAAELDRPQPK